MLSAESSLLLLEVFEVVEPDRERMVAEMTLSGV